MANGSSRVLPVILSLVVGVVGWLVGCAQPAGDGHPTPGPVVSPAPSPVPTPTLPQANNWNIQIGDDPCDLTDDDHGGQKASPQVVSAGNGHRIKWHSKPPSNRYLYVILHVPHTAACPNPPKPFPNAESISSSPSEDLYVIGNGTKHNIDSDKVNPQACVADPNDRATWIKYDQYIQIKGSVFRYCDGWIIIRP